MASYLLILRKPLIQSIVKYFWGNLRTMRLIKVLYDFLRPAYVIDPKNAMSMERYPVQAKLTCGAPQGSILGSLLFLMYINDLPNCLDISCAKMFADDTNITVSGCTFAELQLATNSELINLYSG